MCDTQGQPVQYEALIPENMEKYRNALMDYVGLGMYGNQISPYPGQLPFTGAPNPGQMADMNVILSLMGYPTMQMGGLPPNTMNMPSGGADNIATTQTSPLIPAAPPTKPPKDPYAAKKKVNTQ